MCKLRDNTTRSKGLITWAREAMHIYSVLPAVLFLTRFIRQATWQVWLLSSSARFYAFPLTWPIFQSPQALAQNFRPQPLPVNIFIPPSLY